MPPQSRYCRGDRIHSAFYIFSRRPRFEPLSGGPANLPQVRDVSKRFRKNAREGLDITARVHEAGLLVNDQIARRTHAVARSYYAAAQHRLIDDYAERIIPGRQDH
jgi:hypothetical protein